MTLFSRILRIGWSLLAVVVIVGLVPYILIMMGRWRFGSARPWEGLNPSELIDQAAALTSLGGRITDQMLVDLTVRLTITFGWICVVMLVVSVAAEMLHQVGRGRRPAPKVRSLGWSQALVGSIATGLLLLLPVHGTASAWVGVPSAVERGSTSSVVAGVVHVAATETTSHLTNHTVRPGESLWEIAEQRLGDPLRWKEIWALNQGREMGDGQRFEDPHLILPRWVLQLPSDSQPADSLSTAPVRVYGESAPLSAGSEPNVLQTPEPHQLSEVALADALFDLQEAELIGRERTHSGWETDVLAGGGGEIPIIATEVVDDDLRSLEHQHSDEEAGDLVSEDHSGNEVRSVMSNLLRLGSATMLATGVMVSLAARRRQRLRSSTSDMRPLPIDRLLMDRHLTETAMMNPLAPVAEGRDIDWDVDLSEFAEDSVASGIQTAHAADRIFRLDLVVRIAAVPLIEVQQTIAAVFMSDQGDIEILATAEVMMDRPWRGNGQSWKMPAQIGIDRLIELAQGLDPPCPALVHIGNSSDGREIYVDLEVLGVVSVVSGSAAIGGVVSGKDIEAVDEVLRAIHLTLQNSIFGHSLDLLWVGAPDHEEVIWSEMLGAHDLGYRKGFEDIAEWLEERDPNRLQVVVVSSALDLAEAPNQLWMSETVVIGRGVVRASGAYLVMDGGNWSLNGPVFGGWEIPLTPVGVSASEAQMLAELIEEQSEQPLLVYHADHLKSGVEREEPAAGVVSLHLVGSAPDTNPPLQREHTAFQTERSESGAPNGWDLMVRLMGTVDVVNTKGEVARFERSKSLELLAWCVTHRGRSTRTAARTALWELNVRDATFANVVSEARRATSALVRSEQNRDWIRRTLTEELVLDSGITSDVEIMRATLDRVDQCGVAGLVPEMEAALALIRGMPCEGSSYLWPEAEGISSDLILVATSLASSLALYRLADGDVTGVFRATAAGLLALPGHEELIALRMRAHAAAGDLAGVKQEWVAYQRVIARDPWSGGEPAPKLRDLSIELLGMRV
jgi:hypothetical protein